ncbi:probable esterase [Prochlorococcus marinus str. MIT 9515]|uniref:Probable esterase n=1 Tax=Prochlorococcus marinus (strain MIT 9515) TaxID=167542 RepID=A2BUP8_PROM5|nr:hypothetical protein [Prochlorococcus marinus]ABM71509.1 probable esterase [Prochlorococcus marinus str. MIT 9515]
MKYDINHEYVSISSQTAKHRIILIHGWGADAEDLLPIGQEIIEISNVDFEVLSLKAPSLHPNNVGRQWYGLYPPDWNKADDEVDQLLRSLRMLGTCNIPLEKTILLGFSQGGAMAIDVGCKLNVGLIVACSGYAHPNWEPNEKCPPILISHGLMDEVVPISASKYIYQKIKNVSHKFCELNEFDGYHQIDPNLIHSINLKIKELF